MAAGIGEIIARQEQRIGQDWLSQLKETGVLQTGRLREAELKSQVETFLKLLREAAETGRNTAAAEYAEVRQFLSELSRSRAIQGFTPSETATFVFSLKQPLFAAVQAVHKDAAAVAEGIRQSTLLLDALGLHVMEVYQQSREELVVRQQQEIAELSTPVIKLWEGILALPLIGTLDSSRTQVVMETLLQSIVDHSADIAIIDITGVPTVDTLVAQHLLKTVAAARLMGADCIVSGIRPQIAQTMVHLGVELNVVSKSNLADAFALALARLGRTVVASSSSPAGVV